jgi:plastocyanin
MQAFLKGGAVLLCLVGLLLGDPASAQQAQTYTVEMSKLKFMPDTITVHVGDTVVFVNKDIVPHTATQKPAGWDSSTIKKDGSWTFRAEAAGSFDIICRFHPVMKGKLVVE